MDKETLSNYGWVVICVLVLVVMIALATPFGSFIANAVKNTTSALFGATQERAEIAGLNIEDVVFPCDHEYENDRCKNCGQLDPNHTHTYPATGLTAKCEVCGDIKDHSHTYGSNNLCTQCGEEKVVEYAFSAYDYKNKTGIDLLSGDVIIPETFTSLDGTKYKVTSIGGVAFISCDSLTSVSIPDSVTSIGSQAFQGCKSLTSIGPKGSGASVEIPNSVTSIGYQAFLGCTSLTSITIPDGVTSIGERAFYNCTSIKSITIPDSVTSIGQFAFYYCTSLTSVTIGNGVTSIGDYAFYHCTPLTSVTIPDGVTSIGMNAFAWCTSLTSITYTGTQAQWSAITKGANWKQYVPSSCVHCTDGDLAI